jgi:hypothetical protein
MREWGERFPLILLALAVAGGVAATVRAQTDGSGGASGSPVEAAQLYDRGLRLHQAWVESAAADGSVGDTRLLHLALEAFEESQRLEPNPDTLFAIAECRLELGEEPEAANAYDEYERRMVDLMTPEERGVIRGRLRDLTALVGRLLIEGAADGATILIDGRPAGTAPLPSWVAVEPGRRVVAATGEGVRAGETTVEVRAGEVVRVELRAGERVAGGGEVVASGGALLIPRDDPVEPWFWTAVGIGSAAVAALAVTGGLSLHYWGEWVEDGGFDDDPNRGRGETYGYVTDGLIALAAVAGIAAIWLYFELAPEEQEYLEGERPPDGVDVGLLPGGLVLRW